MKILKRDGSYEKLSFDKILYRIRKLANDKTLGPLKSIDPDIIAQKVVNSIFDGISSSELDEEAARLSVGMTEHPEYPKLAARIVVSNLHKSTIECFSEVMEMLYEYTDANGEKVGYISDELIESVRKHKDVLNFCMDFSRDYNFDYFGFKTLERSYLLKINKRVKVGDSFINKMVVVERPQHMYLRVALGLFRDDIDNVLKTYDLISRGMFTFASPTLFNSGLKLGQLSSCFTGDTIVATVNRGPVPIKNIEIGDQVVTHLGNVKRVVQLHCNPLGERRLYQVQTECGHPGLSGSTGVVKVTDNHRVQVNGIGWVSVGDLDPEQHLLSVASGLRGMSFTKQEIVDVNDLPEYVYTLGVEDDHSYTLECGIIAENCFLLGTDDSLSGIFKTMTDCAKISKVAGGIGVHISNIRAKGSLIRGTHGTSDGIVPMLKVYNDISLYINQSGKRKGSFSVYLETWHADIFEFLDLKKNQGHDNVRARDLFYAMWIPDLFMKRVEENGDWYLMCPDECPGLQDAYGDKFDRLYNGYVEENRYRKKIKAQDLWFKILEAQIETGTPYMLYKDSVNKKSNQREYGTIRSSNLCVRGDTLILTNTGYHPIEHLKDQNVGVWNGHEWSKVTVKQTGTGQQLLRVTLNDGSSLDCTDYHKFYDPRGNEIRAGDLVKGTELLSAKKFPIIREGTSSETQSVPIPYTFGLLDKDPPINCDLTTKLRWLEGFFEGRRGLTFCYKADQLQFVNQLRLFFNTLGVIPQIVQAPDSNWHVSILLRDIQLLTNLGLTKCPSLVAGTFNGTPKLAVTDIKKLPGTFDTFCFTEPLRGKGIFNGILTGQCSEITLYSDPNETAVCNLLSIALPKFVDIKKRTFNFEELKEVARYAVRGMNKVIDVNYYSTPESEYSNKKHRPLGLGIQGENDVFIMMRYPFESAEARQLNKDMFEAIYYGAVEGSIDMAEEDGPYSTYAGSPFSQGLLQFDLWAEHDPTVLDFLKESRWDWKNLKERMKKHGMRNSMLTTCMPTASTAQILGNTECMEPIDSCIFKRRVLSGDFTVINKHLVEDLMKLGLWSNQMKERIIIDNGSIQRIPEIPDDIKALYKTVWEISQKTLIDYSADRGPFIDHSQSLNLFVEKPTLKKLTSMHFYGWKKGLKTGMYYLRSKSAAGAAKFSVDATLEAKSKDAKYTEEEKLACSLANPEACEACSG